MRGVDDGRDKDDDDDDGGGGGEVIDFGSCSSCSAVCSLLIASLVGGVVRRIRKTGTVIC